MGALHGRLAAADAIELFEFYRAMPERVLAGDMRGPAATAGRWVARQLATAWQTRLVKERKAEHADRTEAFIGAVLAQYPDRDPAKAQLALATMDVLQNCVSRVARFSLGPFARIAKERAVPAAIPACSTAIAWGKATADGELLFGRNFDFPGVGVWDAAPSFVACAPDRGQRYGFFATRGADTCVVTVVNEAGLVIAPHTRWHRDVTWGGAMIVDVIHDIARRAETLEDAVRIARERPISSSWGVAIGSAREKSALVIEVGGPHLEIVRPVQGAETLVCTNRYRGASMQAGQFAASTAWSEHSERRERRLRSLVEGRVLTAQDLARALGDRHDVEAPAIRRRMGATLAQTANVHCAVVQPATRRAWVGVDSAPACHGDWAELAWSWDGPTGKWELGDGATESGFTAAIVPDFVEPHDAADRHVHEAIRAHDNAHDTKTARAALERAVAIDPADPSLRLAAAWLALEDGDPKGALPHVAAGLARETEKLRRAQLLLWGARAARGIDAGLVTRWTDELLVMRGVDDVAREAKRRWSGRPHVNLLMVDAY